MYPIDFSVKLKNNGKINISELVNKKQSTYQGTAILHINDSRRMVRRQTAFEKQCSVDNQFNPRKIAGKWEISKSETEENRF